MTSLSGGSDPTTPREPTPRELADRIPRRGQQLHPDVLGDAETPEPDHDDTDRVTGQLPHERTRDA